MKRILLLLVLLSVVTQAEAALKNEFFKYRWER